MTKKNVPGTIALLSDMRKYLEEMDSVALAARKGTAAELAATFVEVRAFYDLMDEMNVYITKIKNRMAQEDIPKAFESEGLTTLTLKGGYRVTISSQVRASTKDMETGINWMRRCECGHPLDMHEMSEQHADGVCTQVIKTKPAEYCPCTKYNAPNAAIVKETINASTLAAFAKSEMEEGRELPDDIFNVYIMPNTSVTRVGK